MWGLTRQVGIHGAGGWEEPAGTGALGEAAATADSSLGRELDQPPR